MHRLFVAIRPPEHIRDLLMDAMDDTPDFRWQHDDQLHLTLRFVGEVERPLADDLADALGRIRSRAFDIRVRGVGRFEQRNSGALWAGVEPKEPLAALAAKVERACLAIGLEPERHALHPHITLARLNRSAGPVAPFLTQHGDLASAPFVFDHVILYESEMGHGGSRYHPVARYPLECSATSAAATALTSSHVAAKPSSSP